MANTSLSWCTHSGSDHKHGCAQSATSRRQSRTRRPQVGRRRGGGPQARRLAYPGMRPPASRRRASAASGGSVPGRGASKRMRSPAGQDGAVVRSLRVAHAAGGARPAGPAAGATSTRRPARTATSSRGAKAARPRAARTGPAPGQRERLWLLTITLCLLAYGLVMAYSASIAMAYFNDQPSYYWLERQLVFAVLGVVAMVVLSRVDYVWWQRAAVPLSVAAPGGAVPGPSPRGRDGHQRRPALDRGQRIHVPAQRAGEARGDHDDRLAGRAAARRAHRGQGVRPHGRRLRRSGGGADHARARPGDDPRPDAVRDSRGRRRRRAPAPPLACWSPPASQRSVSRSSSSPIAWRAITAFIDPWQDPQGTGFQTTQSLISVASGRLFGVGLGNSVQKFGFLPEQTTDMITGIIGEELGLIGMLVLIALYVGLAWIVFRIALMCRETYGKLLAVGIGSAITAQATINIGAALSRAAAHRRTATARLVRRLESRRRPRRDRYRRQYRHQPQELHRCQSSPQLACWWPPGGPADT